MGNCLRRSAVAASRDGSNEWRSSSIAVGKNQPLRRGPCRWCSSQPIFPSLLQQKRAEFWDTAPAFEGRQEIWDALRSAAQAVERGDHELAQAIVDSANIILPTGTLAECYDELGMRYQLPVFVISKPTNLQSEPPPPEDCTLETNEDFARVNSLDVVAIVNLPPSSPMSNQQQPDHFSTSLTDLPSATPSQESQEYSGGYPHQHHGRSARTSHNMVGGFARYFRVDLHQMRKRRSPHSVHGDDDSRSREGRKKRLRFGGWFTRRDTESGPRYPVSVVESGAVDKDKLLDLRLRLSTGDEYQITVLQTTLILDAKKALSRQIGWQPDRQRWFCSGTLLRDHMRVVDCRIPPGFIVQVIVHSPLDPEASWKNNQSVQ